MILTFFLRFSTKFGQSLFVSGSPAALGADDVSKAIPLQYFNDQFWQGTVEIDDAQVTSSPIEYRYLLHEADHTEVVEWGNDRHIETGKGEAKSLVIIDTWNHAGDIANAFYTQAFHDVLLKAGSTPVKSKPLKNYTHEFKVKAPILGENEVLFLTGIGKELGDWKTETPMVMTRSGNWWTTRVNLSGVTYPIAYKYGVFNQATNSFVQFESGINRTLPVTNLKGKNMLVHDGFAQVPVPKWKGAGVAIPVFSLRSKNGFGTGEFADIKLLVDWAKITGLKLIQLLPINDTTATHTFLDSYPYAAISAFALHPLYLNLGTVAGKKYQKVLAPIAEQQVALNALPEVDYEEVMKVKFDYIRRLYNEQKTVFKNDPKYVEFFELNKHWLVPYAAFCYLRDKNKTADYSQWKSHSVFNEASIQKIAAPGQKQYDSIALHYFIQFHLHLQLKDATAYAHSNGIVVKGDLPIGIYRYGCDAWMEPDLYNMNAQAGAPPDGFAIKGQNWGFPTYNWTKMQEDGFSWWRRRFEQMSHYFDAFRIDHILGFFRIWSIPLNAVEGILGKFVPAIPLHPNEFYQLGISFMHQRYCKPYITEAIVNDRFGGNSGMVKSIFLDSKDGQLQLKPEFDTQRKIEAYFKQQGATTDADVLKQGLFDLVSNVILLEEEGSGSQQFHFRINMDETTSFRDLDEFSKEQLKKLYVNYFYRRQDDFWRKEAMKTLPELKRSTNMLVCGEDLGMVPACVPDVMRELGILSLEIQRMPKDPKTEFFHPADAPYLSVVTPSTHDMSTIRGWWEEDHGKSQRFYNNILGHYGSAPFFCEAWLNKEIIIQHLYSPAMWSILQLQDLLGIDETIRRNDPHEERINIPADPKHYWRYRMHIGLEKLALNQSFNQTLKEFVQVSGR
ncbi:MAG: 4-alpha-glucanotransferase [Ferruginibacter sp.]|nr:4-alpha-glucanotransferase [Ferruginibacter sp.]